MHESTSVSHWANGQLKRRKGYLYKWQPLDETQRQGTVNAPCCTCGLQKTQSTHNSIRFPTAIKNLAYTQRYQRETEKRILGQLIRVEYHAIHASKSKANKLQASMHRRSDQYQRLNDLVNAAAHASKTKWKSSLKQKFKRLTESREQPDGTLLLGPGCVPN